MRIVIATACDFPDGIGGGPRMVWLMARGFARLGHEVIVASTYGTWEGPKEKSYGEWTSIRASNSPQNAANRDRLPHRVRTHLAFLCLLLRLLFRRKPDVFSFYGPLMLYSVVALAAEAFTKCRTCYCHADGFPNYEGMSLRGRVKYTLVQAVERILSRHCSCILLVGTSLFEDHIHRLAPRTPLIRGRGVPTDIDAFASGNGNRFRETYGIPWERLVVCTGALCELDGTHILLRAFSALRGQRKDVGLIVTGCVATVDPVRGKPLDYVALAEQLGIADVVRFVGHIPRDHLYDALAAADVLVMAKINHRLNHVAFPIKLTEDLASGRPVVSSRICEIDQFATDGQHLLFVPPDDPKGLADAISRILDDPSLARSLGSKGKELAEEVFDYRKWFAHVAPVVLGSDNN